MIASVFFEFFICFFVINSLSICCFMLLLIHQRHLVMSKIIFGTIFDKNKPVPWIWYSFRTFLLYEARTNLLILLNVFSKDKKYPPREAVWPSKYNKIHQEKLAHHDGHAAKLFVCWKTIRHLNITLIVNIKITVRSPRTTRTNSVSKSYASSGPVLKKYLVRVGLWTQKSVVRGSRLGPSWS